MVKVFIADDESMIVESLKASIPWEEYGCRISGEAYDGDDALERILALEPDIVFIDIRMPGKSGLDVIRTVRETLPGVQFIVVSGYSEFEYAQKAINYGVLGYCLKPFDEEEIGKVLQRAVDLIQETGSTISPSDRKGESSPEQSVGKMMEAPMDNTAEIAAGKPFDTAAGRLKGIMTENPDLGKIRNNTFKALLLYVHEHYTRNPITVQELSARFSINQSYISQLFKKELGTTFSDYLNRLRIAHALELLKDAGLNINEVADRSGYSDYFYFAHIFKKLTGKTPTQYRNEN